MDSRVGKAAAFAVLALAFAHAAAAVAPRDAREWSWPVGEARALAFATTAGEVRIVASDGDRIVVRGGHLDRDDAPEVRYVVKRGVGRLEVHGRGALQLVVELPRALALTVRMSAGELAIGAFESDLDVRLRAGEVTVDAVSPAHYADIDVSVLTGEIVWRDENVRHGGLFRSYDRTGTGRAEQRVRVRAGSIEIV